MQTIIRATGFGTLVLLAIGFIGLTRSTGDAAADPTGGAARKLVDSGPVTITTTDGAQLNGMYRTGRLQSEIGLLLIHGFTGTFEEPPIAILAETLAERGYSTLALNMRDAGCCTYTTLFEDNVTDIDAGVQFLIEAGASRIVVLGHSLGANRVTYYRAQVEDPAVRAIVVLAGVGNAYRVASAFDGQGRGANALAEASRRLTDGDGLDDLLEVPLGAFGTYYYTPASLVSNGSPETNSDLFKWIPSITLPLLIVHATNDGFLPFQRPELAQQGAVRSPRADLVYVEGANHSFTGRTDEVTGLLDTWVSEVLPQ